MNTYNKSRNYLRPVTPKKEKVLSFPFLMLLVLITSTFYVVPLGRFEYFGTSFRLFDFVFAFFFVFVAIWDWQRVIDVVKQNKKIFWWSSILLLMVWGSLIFTILTGSASRFLPALIRSIRFSAYFFTGAFVVAFVDSLSKFRWALNIFYINIIVQAALSTAQKIGLIGTFWPTIYTMSYGTLPVGTLSAHHKHIGVVMLLGVGISLTFIRANKGVIRKLFAIIFMGLMIAATVFAISRTAWLGMAGLAAAYFFVYKERSLGIGILVVIGLILSLLILQWSGIDFISLLEEDVSMVVFDPYEREGIVGITGDRLKVYDNFPDAVAKAPWILLTGSGFQNAQTFIRSAGAHNNYFQVLFELGIFGFIVYLGLLQQILKELLQAGIKLENKLQQTLAKDTFAVFIGILLTLFVGETFWGQPSMQTLTAQIMILVGLAVSPMYQQELQR